MALLTRRQAGADAVVPEAEAVAAANEKALDHTERESLPEIDRQAEKKLLWKLDLAIVPMVMLLYLLNNLDRVNLGNARLFHLDEDLNLHGNRYQLAVSILFVT